jgi:hypothetical protein
MTVEGTTGVVAAGYVDNALDYIDLAQNIKRYSVDAYHRNHTRPKFQWTLSGRSRNPQRCSSLRQSAKVIQGASRYSPGIMDKL